MMISNEQENVIQLPVSVCEMFIFNAHGCSDGIYADPEKIRITCLNKYTHS